MESLLPYYERELTYLRRLSSDFAKKYPKVAGRLLLSGEACDDPHIERLIESFAFLSGRIHKKLDDDFPEISDALLQVIYPQSLRPFPAATIACFDCSAALAQARKPITISRHTLLKTHPVKGVACHFRTSSDLQIWPLRLAGACFENLNDGGVAMAAMAGVIRLDLAVLAADGDLSALQFGKVRFHMNGEPSLVAAIREALLARAASVWVSHAGAGRIRLHAGAISAVGFAEDEALLPQEARSQPACRLLLEYFAFPEKFNFFDIDLTGLNGRLPPGIQTLEIRIGLADIGVEHDGGMLSRLAADNFVLGCVPVLNLFRRNAEPIRVSGTKTAYPVIIDSHMPRAYDIYEIARVARVRRSAEAEEVTEYRPFYSLRHGDDPESPAHYWHASHIEGDDALSHAMEISLVDSCFDPHRAESSTLSMMLMCTNGNLPSQLPFGLTGGDLFMEGGSVARNIRMLRKPTRSHVFPRGRGAQWRLISHLSLNHLSWSGQGVDALRETLHLYDITSASQNCRQIDGIVAVEQEMSMARIAGNPFPQFVRGIGIRVTVDESHYAGIGLFMFAQILDHFFGMYVQANSFVQLSIFSRQSGMELIKCPARSGKSILA